MNRAELENLICLGESATVEFLGEEQGACDDDGLLEATVALANRPGPEEALLLVGIENDGQVSGARPRHGTRTEPRLVQAMLANRTRPSLRCKVSLAKIGGAELLVIAIPAARAPVGTDRGLYLRRGQDAKGRPVQFPFHFHEMQARQAGLALLDYAALTVPDATWDDLDPLEFERFRRCVRESRGRGEETLLDLSPLDLARALGAVEPRGTALEVRVLGLLLFGREEALRRFLPTHEVAIQVLAGTEVRANEFHRWPLLRLLDELLMRFRAGYRESELLVGMRRTGVAHLSEKAFREAAVNALVHRDYARLGAVHVQWHGETRVRFCNPGGFPEGVRLDNLLVTAPKPRNPLLAEAFKRAGLVERTSRGVDTIFEESLRTGHDLPSYACSTSVDVVLDLPAGRPDLAFAGFAQESLGQGEDAVALNELLLLHALANGEPRLDVAAAAALIQLPAPVAMESLERLATSGVLATTKAELGKRTYHLTPAAAAKLGRAPALLAAQEPGGGDDKAERILAYVRDHGRIKRDETAALCTVTPRQASYLLDKLVQTGQLTRTGERRGVEYHAVDRQS